MSFYGTMYKVFAPMVRALYRIETVGQENIPEGGVILASNHTAFSDVLVISAAAKFSTLYILVAQLICGVLSESLIAAGHMKPPMVQALPATFSWPQLFTALIGGAVALVMVPMLKKALHK